MPNNAPKAKQRPTRSKSRTGDDVVDELDEWKKSRQLLRPKDQLELTDTELKEEVARVLTTINPQLPQNLVDFCYKDGAYVPADIPPGTLILLDLKGTSIYKYSEEARLQCLELGLDMSLQGEEAMGAAAQAELQSVTPTEETASASKDTGEQPPQDEDEEKAEEESGPKEESEEKKAGSAGAGEEEEPDEFEPPKTTPSGKKKKLVNQFNFCERAAQTYSNPMRDFATQTVPPPRATYAANNTQWGIYDAYQADFEEQEREKEREKQRHLAATAMSTAATGAGLDKQAKGAMDEAALERLGEAWRTMERMINQNTYDEIAQDYRYWEDPADEFRDEEGTLLPLWKFFYEKTRKCTVTDLLWNPEYYDLFAATFGSMDHSKPQPEGALCLFTLKNPSHPEFIAMTPSMAMCVDIHPNYPYMVVVGLYDGNVLVYNAQYRNNEPQYQSDAVLNKHEGIVWEVKWGPDLQDGEMNFYSASGDGRINNWVLMQNELAPTTVITLYLDEKAVHGPDGTSIRLKGCASCLAFHPTEPLVFLVGTEEGLIYKCSTAYSSMYLLTYKAHHMPVYRIDYNKFNTDIFISCSGDWRIKIWEDDRLEPLFVFDMGAGVGDVRWAPYSSTVFAAATSEGKAYIFDLGVKKHRAICDQAVVSRRRHKLTRLAFNPKLPILIIGDDKGTVTCAKLSPNLRLMCKPPKKQLHLDQHTMQCMKLEKLLSIVREPKTLNVVPDDRSEGSKL